MRYVMMEGGGGHFSLAELYLQNYPQISKCTRFKKPFDLYVYWKIYMHSQLIRMDYAISNGILL